MTKLVGAQKVPSTYDRASIFDLVRLLEQQGNDLAEGRIVARHGAVSSVPTTGTFAKGDIVWDSAPALSLGTVRLGWICTVAGSPGTFQEIRTRIAGVPFKVGSFTRDLSLANGNQAVTGVGFTPQALVFFANVNGSSAFSVGFTTLAAQGAVGDDNVDAAGTYAVFTDRLAFLGTGAATSNSAAIASMDADGFTVTWTKSGSPSGTATINYLAFR